MRPVELNLASRPFRNNTPIWTGLAFLAAAGIAATTLSVLTYLEQRDDLASLEAKLEEARSSTADLDRRDAEAIDGIRTFDFKVLRAQTRRANDVLARRGLSWTRLFNKLEDVQPYEVRLTSVRPIYNSDVDRRGRDDESMPAGTVQINVEGLAQSIEAFLEFQRALVLDRHFTRVQPERMDPQPGSEVEFEMRFFYDPEGRLEKGDRPEIPAVLDAVARAEADGEPPPGAEAEEAPR